MCVNHVKHKKNAETKNNKNSLRSTKEVNFDETVFHLMIIAIIFRLTNQ